VRSAQCTVRRRKVNVCINFWLFRSLGGIIRGRAAYVSAVCVSSRAAFSNISQRFVEPLQAALPTDEFERDVDGR